MKDNLPEINFKQKKDRKGGALGWLRSKLGLGSRGAMGEAGINPAAMNVGKALGGANLGSSSAGLAGLLAGKAGIIATVAVMAVGTGVYLANKEAPRMSNSAFTSGRVADNYVPAILRSQAANQGSSLDMFKDTNKKSGLKMEADPKKAAGKPADGAPAAAEAAPQDAEQPAPGGNMAQEMMGKLQGGEMGSLTSSMGGGANKFSGMGGFSNKFNQGNTGAKSGFTSGIGAGFQGMPKFDARKGKMTAMKAASRPVFSSSKAGKKGKFGTGAFGQAKGLRKTQQSYAGTNTNVMRTNEDVAWGASTPDGEAEGGAGVGDGGAGIMTSPSLENAGSTGPGTHNPDVDPCANGACGAEDVSPWKGMPEQALQLIVVSFILSFIAAYIVQIGYDELPAWWAWIIIAIGWIIAAIAMYMAFQAMEIGRKLMSDYGQKDMGGVYILGGIGAAVAAGMAFLGEKDYKGKMTTVAAMAAAVLLIGSMLGK